MGRQSGGKRQKPEMRLGLRPFHHRRHRRQDRFDIAAGLQPEKGRAGAQRTSIIILVVGAFHFFGAGTADPPEGGVVGFATAVGLTPSFMKVPDVGRLSVRFGSVDPAVAINFLLANC